MFGRIQRDIVLRLGRANKKSFKNSLVEILAHLPANKSGFDVISMSGKKYFEDQLLSLFSFYYNVGTPRSWTIYNDGSYTNEEILFFSNIPNVAVKNIIVEEEFKELASTFPTLKKVFIFKNTSVNNPSLFVDSDVLFYNSFQKDIQPFISKSCYLVDEGQGYFDEDLAQFVSRENPLNLGFLLLNSTPDWQLVFDYLGDRIKKNRLNYWSDQTAFHILAKKESFTPLPANKFVTGGKDAFTIKNAVDYSKIALRHFVGPVRHKMWQMHWSKILGIQQ